MARSLQGHRRQIIVDRLGDGRRNLAIHLVIVPQFIVFIVEQFFVLQQQLWRWFVRRRRRVGVLVMRFGACGACCAIGLAGCSYLPAAQEKARTEEALLSVPEVLMADVECDGRVFSSNALCATVVFKDGNHIRFERIGAHEFGASALNIVVSQVNNLMPRLATCDGVGAPNLHRSGPLGHHFRPPMADLKEAVRRHRLIEKEIQYWPECPQSWEVQDVFGVNYRYCARKKDLSDEPPRPDNCH